jgi:hypothetical protein
MQEIKILEEDDSVLVLLGTKELNVLDYSQDGILVECHLHDLSDLDLNLIPEHLVLQIHDSHGFETYLFYTLEISKIDNSVTIDFVCHSPNKNWEGRWGQCTYLSAIIEQVKFFPEISVQYLDLEDDWKSLTLRFNGESPTNTNDYISLAINRIIELIKQSEIFLGGITWKQDYEKNEDIFCREILAPMLRRMGFLSVRYTHGKKEYGKDFTFSELTLFGDLRHYGLQAKAGNVSGGVNSDIDELIGQINDAFCMPYYELGSKDPRYISTFIIAISGHFTENAREKIVEKMPKGVIGSVYFLDKEKITELIEKYWVN